MTGQHFETLSFPREVTMPDKSPGKSAPFPANKAPGKKAPAKKTAPKPRQKGAPAAGGQAASSSPPEKARKTGKGQEAPATPEYTPGKKNICCRRCFLTSGYDKEEQACHFCGAEIYEIDAV